MAMQRVEDRQGFWVHWAVASAIGAAGGLGSGALAGVITGMTLGIPDVAKLIFPALGAVVGLVSAASVGVLFWLVERKGLPQGGVWVVAAAMASLVGVAAGATGAGVMGFTLRKAVGFPVELFLGFPAGFAFGSAGGLAITAVLLALASRRPAPGRS